MSSYSLVSHSLHGSAILWHSDRACRVVYTSVVCFMLVYAQFRARNSAAILILSYRLPAVHGDDVVMPPVIVIFPRAR